MPVALSTHLKWTQVQLPEKFQKGELFQTLADLVYQTFHEILARLYKLVFCIKMEKVFTEIEM